MSTILMSCVMVVTWSWAPAARADADTVMVPIPMHELSSERPIDPVPGQMTFEEYEDMNRSIGMALPYGMLPGGIHRYAGETTTGWVLAGSVAMGVALIVAGASMARDDGDWEESDYETVDIDEQRYARVPTSQELTGTDTTTHYRLDPLHRQDDGGGGLLVGLGAVTILSVYVYDFLGGMQVINEKRNRVRYKYGQQLTPSVAFDPRTGEPRLALDLRF